MFSRLPLFLADVPVLLPIGRHPREGGHAFCAGADIRAFHDALSADSAGPLAFLRDQYRLKR